MTITVVFYRDKETNELICSHGIEIETLKTVILPEFSFSYYRDLIEFDSDLHAWVLKSSKGGTI